MSDRDAALEETKQSFLRESDWLRFSSPLFSALMRASAADSDILKLGAESRPGQSAGFLLPVVTQFLLFGSPDTKLAKFFPSITATPDPAEKAFPAFREFCLERREEVAQLLAQRTVNTNLVERASVVLPALAHVGQLTQEPLTLVEICCSLGLNLLFDEYHYDYGPAGRLGREQSPMQLSCKLIGSARSAVASIPRVAERVGVDLVKVDPSDPVDGLWMEAALCPEWSGERKNLKVALAFRTAHPLRIIIGDALEVLPSLVVKLPGALCVLHTYCMGQWSQAAKSRLDDILRTVSRDRDVHRLGFDIPDRESPESIRGRLVKLASAGIPMLHKSFPSVIEHTWYAKSDAKTHLLGQADGFGAWLDWSSPAAR